MTGFVGAHAKKKQRTIFYTLILLLFIIFFILLLPTFENDIDEIIPNDSIMPDLTKDFTSLSSNIEDLELSLFQKDQKIKFRDGQIKNLQIELLKIQSQYDSVILDLNSIENKSDAQGLISSNNYKLLQEKFTKLNTQNEKNILIIKNLNQNIDDFNNNIFTEDAEVEKIILDNKKLTKDFKSIFAKNIKLDNIIKGLKNNINDQSDQISLQLEQIKKLKDISHHGG